MALVSGWDIQAASEYFVLGVDDRSTKMDEGLIESFWQINRISGSRSQSSVHGRRKASEAPPGDFTSSEISGSMSGFVAAHLGGGGVLHGLNAMADQCMK